MKRFFVKGALPGYELACAPELELNFNKGNGKFIKEIW